MQRRPRGHHHLPQGLSQPRPLPGVPPALRDPVPAIHTQADMGNCYLKKKNQLPITLPITSILSSWHYQLK